MGIRTFVADRFTSRGALPRDHWQRHLAALSPVDDHLEIQQVLAMHEFPWDTTQSLSFALFRTYAVPGIGRLLYETGEFTRNTQKRYDDTALLLEYPLLHGFDHPEARAAVRRINQMHRAYGIPDHEMRYVLSTFVVVPPRWIEQYGYRPLTENEIEAIVRYYRALGRHMGIPDLPETFEGFADLMDTYEAEHFAHDSGGRAVADATLALLCSFYPRPLRRAVRLFSLSLMDEPLRRAFGYRSPPAPVVALSRGALRARGRVIRLLPSRKDPFTVAMSPNVKGYTVGVAPEELGTFTLPGQRKVQRGCPVPHPGGSLGVPAPRTGTDASTGSGEPVA